MIPERSMGLILRVRPLTETSLIVQWLTPDLGRLATVAKGARRPKSPFRGRLDLFYRADFSFQRSRRSELHALREVELQATHEFLRHDLSLLQQASQASALLERATETETPLPGLFQLMVDFLESLGRPAAGHHGVSIFEIKLLRELGLQPDLGSSRLTPGSRRILQHFSEEPWTSLASIKPSAAQETEIRRFLDHFLAHHLGQAPTGRIS